MQLRGFSKSQTKQRLAQLLQELNIEHIANNRGDSLSGGERRRVEIARSLVTHPGFLLLDEPFTGIDPIVRADIQEIIIKLKDQGIGILITDHNVRETLEITDRAYIMYEGRILLSGDAQTLINDTFKEIQEFLKENPKKEEWREFFKFLEAYYKGLNIPSEDMSKYRSLWEDTEEAFRCRGENP